MLQQPDAEFYDTSKKNIEKYLIKWAHASYLHVSWETEKDIIDLVGSIAKVCTYSCAFPTSDDFLLVIRCSLVSSFLFDSYCLFVCPSM